MWCECAWKQGKELAEARERMMWHELMSRRNIEGSEVLQERRVIEYVAVRDFQTAVGFLLASTPERSIRYYRDALCTLALAVRPRPSSVGGACGPSWGPFSWGPSSCMMCSVHSMCMSLLQSAPNHGSTWLGKC